MVSEDVSSTFYIHSDGKIVLAGNCNNPYSPNGVGLRMIRLVNGSLGTENFNRNGFYVYPNPAGEEISITNPDNQHISELAVFDIYGKQILKQKTSLNTLNIKNLETGVYFLKIKANDSEFVLKFIKK